MRLLTAKTGAVLHKIPNGSKWFPGLDPVHEQQKRAVQTTGKNSLLREPLAAQQVTSQPSKQMTNYQNRLIAQRFRFDALAPLSCYRPHYPAYLVASRNLPQNRPSAYIMTTPKLPFRPNGSKCTSKTLGPKHVNRTYFGLFGAPGYYLVSTLSSPLYLQRQLPKLHQSFAPKHQQGAQYLGAPVTVSNRTD